jgi:hypothetical protein
MSTPSSTELTSEDREIIKIALTHERQFIGSSSESINEYISNSEILILDLTKAPRVKTVERICRLAQKCTWLTVTLPHNKYIIKKYIDVLPFALHVTTLTLSGVISDVDAIDRMTGEMEDLMEGMTQTTDLMLESLRYMHDLTAITIQTNYTFNNLKELILCEKIEDLDICCPITSFEYIYQIPNLSNLTIAISSSGNPVPFDVRDRTDEVASREYKRLMMGSNIYTISFMDLNDVVCIQNLRYLPSLEIIRLEKLPSRFYASSIDALEESGKIIEYPEQEDVSEMSGDDDEIGKRRRESDEDDEEDEDYQQHRKKQRHEEEEEEEVDYETDDEYDRR